jgi:hypothetical protein
MPQAQTSAPSSTPSNSGADLTVFDADLHPGSPARPEPSALAIKSTAVELARRSVETFVSKDIKGWVTLADENILTEFPFAPEGSPRRLEGREALYEYLKNYPSVIDIRSMPTWKAYATDDPDTAIVEWSVSGKVLPNGNSYDMKYATFITFRDGLMTNYREYWDPMTFIKNMGDARF